MKTTMKVKLKGLVLGILIGIFLTTSVAFVSSTQIQVYFKNLKVMFDGVEKKSETGEIFIYNNQTYVPIRFISEALGEKVRWDENNNTVWIGKKIVAVLNDGEIWSDEFDSYLDTIKFFNPRYVRYERQLDYQTYMLNHLIATTILTARADESIKQKYMILAQEDLDSYKQLNTEQSPEEFTRRLTALNLTENDLLQYLADIRIIKHVVVSDEHIKEAYDNARQADEYAYVNATVHHILIATDNRTEEEALVRAQEVRTKLNDGETFAALAEEYSDDYGSRENGGTYEDYPINTWVPEFKEAAAELPINEISEPIKTQFGYHILKVESRHTKTLDEVKEEIRSGLSAAKLDEFMKDELPKYIKEIKLP
jgi:foldase protein PrsA